MEKTNKKTGYRASQIRCYGKFSDVIQNGWSLRSPEDMIRHLLIVVQ